MSHKSVFIAKIAAELAEIRRELRRLAAETSPTKDGAKSLYEAYKKEHPGTEKTVKDFYKPEKKKQTGAASKLKEGISPRNPARKEIKSALKDIEGMFKSIEKSGVPVNEDGKKLTKVDYKSQSTVIGSYVDKDAVMGDWTVGGSDVEGSYISATKASRLICSKSVIGFKGTKTEVESSLFKECKVSVSYAADCTFEDSEVVVLGEASFLTCRVKKGTKIIGDPKMMIFIDGEFEDTEYMEELMSAGAQFVKLDSKKDMKEAEADRDAYMKKINKK